MMFISYLSITIRGSGIERAAASLPVLPDSPWEKILRMEWRSWNFRNHSLLNFRLDFFASSRCRLISSCSSTSFILMINPLIHRLKKKLELTQEKAHLRPLFVPDPFGSFWLLILIKFDHVSRSGWGTWRTGSVSSTDEKSFLSRLRVISDQRDHFVRDGSVALDGSALSGRSSERTGPSGCFDSWCFLNLALQITRMDLI